MTPKEAVPAFAQSEKIKASLIMASQLVELLASQSEDEKRGAEKVFKAFVNMIGNEIHLARKIAQHEIWAEVEKHLDLALVMINSGVAHEAGYHLVQGISQVTRIGQQSMTVLKDKGLI